MTPSWSVVAWVGMCLLAAAAVKADDPPPPRAKTVGAQSVVNTAASPHVKFQNPDLTAVRWTEGFWADRFEQCRRTTVPGLFQVMQKPDNSATFQNLRIAAKLAEGRFFGNYWSDGDCYKLLEAAAALYAVTGDRELDRQLDEWIAVIAKAQAADGYISTQTQLTGRARWQDVKYHELYNMGHLLTAACVHARATGKRELLAVARKTADYLCGVFLPRPQELAHFGFNPSNIMGAAELYRTTGEAKYLRLAKTFVDMRGSAPGGSDQNQARVPLRREREAVGHAVTAAYLWCGAADVYAETGEPALLEALSRLWVDVAERKMYVTGGIGALHHGESDRRLLRTAGKPDSVHEAFGPPYALPNGTAYNETCANIANAMWNWRLLSLTGDARHADVMELVLYNSMLSGIGLEGRDFFYTNPLRRTAGQPMLHNDSARRWVDTTPASPVRCFCCPPNVARTVAELGAWAYGVGREAVWVHLYGGNVLDTGLPGGEQIRLVQRTDYPWEGRVAITVEKAPARDFVVALRIPAWAGGATVLVNGRPGGERPQAASYLHLRRRWTSGDVIEINLPLKSRLVEAHPLVEDNRNHVAVVRGPVVYCLESADLPAGTRLADTRLPVGATFAPRRDSGVLRGATVLQAGGVVLAGAAPSRLYRPLEDRRSVPVELRLIPYYSWANRGEGEMTVWLPLAVGDGRDAGG